MQKNEDFQTPASASASASSAATAVTAAICETAASSTVMPSPHPRSMGNNNGVMSSVQPPQQQWPPHHTRTPPVQKRNLAPQAAAASIVTSTTSTDANAQLYQALMQRKQKEQQMVSNILHDARVITDAMMQKQRDAQVSQVVVSAVGDQYVTNERYIQINSGLETKIKVFPQMHPLSPDECDVYSGLVQRSKSGRVTVMHNHCMSEQGMIEGYRFCIHAREISSILPISRKMFFRHSMVECIPSSGSSAKSGRFSAASNEDSVILNLLFKQNEVVFDFRIYFQTATQAE